MSSSSHCIAITGGRGFIGSQLTRSLLEQGHTVHLLNRGGSFPADIADHPNTRVFQGDITDPGSLPPWIEGCDQLYHLAAFAKPWAPKKDFFYEVNVQGTLNVLDAAHAGGCREIVITSSAGTFGPQTSEEPIRESTPRQLDPFTEYERTKRISVERAREYGKDGLKIRFVSPTRVFGPGELNVSNAVTKMVDQYLKGSFRVWPGDGNRIGNYTYIHDVVRGHQLAMEHGKHGEDYILGGENASYRTFFNVIGTITGHVRKMVGIPVPAMLAAARGMEWWANRTGKAPLITPPFVRKYTHDWGTDVSKAQRELGYKITPLEEALQETVTWLTEREQPR